MLPKGISHHAILVVGDMETIRDKLLASISDTFNTPYKGNPDFHIEENMSVGIDESRRWRDMQSVSPISGNVKVFVISFDSITTEAQNALLKVIEEPATSTRFVFVTASPERLLPTFLSRLFIIKDTSTDYVQNRKVLEFLKAGMAERIEIAKETVGEKDRTQTRLFIEGLAAEFRRSKVHDIEYASALKNISQALSYTADISSSPKIILESLALTLPTL